MYVAGIDYSTHAVDVVLVSLDDDKPPEWERYGLAGGNAFDRTRSVAYRFPGPNSAGWDDVYAYGIEDPRGFNAGALYRVQGAILANLRPKTLVHPLIPSQWRKLVGLPGNATKTAVAIRSAELGALDYSGNNVWPQDAHDAHCIALATRTLLLKEKAA